jgi:hypothetical protein
MFDYQIILVEFNIENPKVDTETKTRNPKGTCRHHLNNMWIPVDEACGNPHVPCSCGVRVWRQVLCEQDLVASPCLQEL